MVFLIPLDTCIMYRTLKIGERPPSLVLLLLPLADAGAAAPLVDARAAAVCAPVLYFPQLLALNDIIAITLVYWPMYSTFRSTTSSKPGLNLN